MTLPAGNSPTQNRYVNAHQDSRCEMHKPESAFGRGPGVPLYKGRPTPPSVRGETHSSNLPSPDEVRPAGDQRSAMQIYYDNPILDRGILSSTWDRSAGGQQRRTKLIDNLKRQVGDFSSANTDQRSRADAMYRLARLANYIDSDPSVERKGTIRAGDGFLEGDGPYGFSSEVERLIEFAGQGYSVLHEVVAQPPASTGRMPGDRRTVEEITAHPLFKGLERFLDAEELQAFKTQVGGDWEDPNLPVDVRADRAADAERVLHFIDQRGGEYSTPNNGKIDGARRVPLLSEEFLTPEDYTEEGSEARQLQSFIRDGYSALEKK